MPERLGQHFLRDPQVVQAILSAAELAKGEQALEIGPGKAVLTEPLAARIARLVAVELDEDLAERLVQRFKTQTKVTIVQDDFLKLDLDALFADQPGPVKVLGNLPYRITAPIFEKLMRWPAWTLGVFLVQKEVADRLCAPQGSRDTGLLTFAVQLRATAEIIRSVPASAFAPPPRVQSAVIRLRRRTQPQLDPALEDAFFDFARSAFAHRRKTVLNSLQMSTGQDKKSIEQWLLQQGIDAGARAETLALEKILKITPEWAIFRRENRFDNGVTNV